MTLRETADQLLVSGELPEMSAARDKTHIISNRMRSLLHLIAAYIESLENKLGVKVIVIINNTFYKAHLDASASSWHCTRARVSMTTIKKMFF